MNWKAGKLKNISDIPRLKRGFVLEESKNKSKKGILFLIIIIILILLLIIGGLVAYILIISKDDKAGLLGKTEASY